MTKIKSFILTFTLGGLVVILPIIIFVKLILWATTFLNSMASPFINLLVNLLQISYTHAQLLTFLIAFASCFFLGIFVRTRLGNLLYVFFENRALEKIPGYKIIKDIVGQFTSSKNNLFRDVVLLKLGDSEIEITGFVTDDSHDERVTVFVPTGPNPTTGLILHAQKKNLTYLDTSVETALKSIISCGAGSQQIIATLNSSSS